MKWRGCSVQGCLRRVSSHGLCDAHYNRLRDGNLKADVPVLALNSKRTRSILKQIRRGSKYAGA